jgi:outer membrane protein
MQLLWPKAIFSSVSASLALTATLAFPTPAGAALPFPAYGGGATDALKPRPVSGIPARVTLAQAIAIAAAASPTLDNARGALQMASADTEIARVGLRPTVTANGQLEGPRSNPNTSQSLSLGLNQLIFDGGEVIANIRTFRAAEEGARYTYRRALQTLTFDVAQAYFAALQAESQTSLAQQIVAQGVAQERLIAAQIDAGTAAAIDLQTAHTSTIQAQGSVITAQSQEIVALAQFANAMGLDAASDVRPQGATASGRTSLLPTGTPVSYDIAVTRALALRPDYLADVKLVESGEQRVRYARLGRAPTLTGTASGGYTMQNGPFGVNQFQPTVLASLKLPLFDGGLAAANTNRARAQLNEATATAQSQQLTVQLDVRTALAKLIAAQALLRQDDESVDLARRVLSGRQEQYQAGKPVLELFLNAQANYAAAQNAQLSALYALRQAEQAYLYALGENDLGETTR